MHLSYHMFKVFGLKLAWLEILYVFMFIIYKNINRDTYIYLNYVTLFQFKKVSIYKCNHHHC